MQFDLKILRFSLNNY